MKRKIDFGTDARTKLASGINKLANAVTSTLGPNGRNVIYFENGTVVSTKDGVSVAKHISSLEDPIEELGAQMIKQASIKTAGAAGDGTTTSTLLAQSIVTNGLTYLNNGVNATEIKRGIDKAVAEVVTGLKKLSEDISSEEQLEQVASISANNDPEIGKLIATAISKVGREGIVTVEESRTGETFLETVEGIQFDRGYKSHYFVTNNDTMSSTLEDPLILIADRKFTQVKDLLPLLENVSAQNKPLLIIAEDIDGEALATLIVNKMRNTLKVCAVKAPDFGDRRKLILEDIAIMTGGTVFSSEKGMKLEKFEGKWFGSARTVTITKESTTIIDGKGEEEKIETRINELQAQIEKSTTPFETEKLQERLAKMVGGVAIIHVGGNTETEMREKKDRVDDALQATKSSIEEGIIPGGGSALVYAREFITFDDSLSDGQTIGKQIIYKACTAPFIKILSNAGYEDIQSYNLINLLDSENGWKGYNLKTESFVDMKEAGILDPTKVTRCALQNASSIASTVLLTEVVITDEKTDKDSAPSNPMEGMF
jgi:chaperonin GroEL